MIGGGKYTVRSHLPPGYPREVTGDVDQALKKGLSQGPIVETPQAAILAALDITNELFLARKGGRETERLLEDAKQKVTVSGTAELLRTRETRERELALRRSDLDKREAALERRTAAGDERERELGRRDQALAGREQALAAREREARTRLERLAGLSAQEAKEELMRGLEEEARSGAAALLR